MTIRDFFNSEAMGLPKARTKGDFPSFLARVFDEYLNAVDGLGPSCHLAEGIRQSRHHIVELSTAIRWSLAKSLGGDADAAYSHLRTFVARTADQLDSLFSLPVSGSALEPFYRMQTPESCSPDRGRLFHIPFERRHLAKPQRYSMADLPCLYLGGSVRLCWEEFKKPSLTERNVMVARFHATRDVRLLDFGFRPSSLVLFAHGSVLRGKDANPDLEKFIVNYARCWPLIAACSVRPKQPRSGFIPEYIIPQMVLKWLISDSDRDGIRYFSIILPPDTDHSHAGMNYVFPVRQVAASGYCPVLTEAFHLSNPIRCIPSHLHRVRAFNFVGLEKELNQARVFAVD